MKISKTSISAGIILTILSFFSLNGQNFEINKILSNNYIHNIVSNEKGVYIGTSDGIFVVDEAYNLKLFNAKIKGAINENFEPVNASLIRYTSSYNELLPKFYQNNSVSAVKQDDHLFLVSRGKLFAYKKTLYSFESTPSVRSISSNYLGTYGGIFKNGAKLQYPTYSSGKIREFENKTFICYDGLYLVDDNGNTKDFKSFEYTSLERQSSFQDEIGLIRDIIYIKKDAYVLFSTRGIYLFELSKEKLTPMYELESQDDFVEFIDHVKSLGVYFFNKNSIYKLDVKERNIQLIKRLDFSSKFLTIDKKKGINKVYVISTSNKLLSYEYVGNKWVMQELCNLNPSSHSIYNVDNYLLIAGNNGLDVFDLTSYKFFKNVIPDELNKYAFYSDKNEVQLGGVYGIYKFNTEDLKSNFNTEDLKSNFNTPNEPNQKTNTEKAFSYEEVFILLLIILVLVVLLVLKTKNKKAKSKNNYLKLKEIDKYIESNITSVSIKDLTDHFGLKVHDIYEIMEEIKPGKYIRNKRMKIVDKMRKEGASIEDISQKSGFSISYLKKL
jgi:competence protein ComGC